MKQITSATLAAASTISWGADALGSAPSGSYRRHGDTVLVTGALSNKMVTGQFEHFGKDFLVDRQPMGAIASLVGLLILWIREFRNLAALHAQHLARHAVGLA